MRIARRSSEKSRRNALFDRLIGLISHHALNTAGTADVFEIAVADHLCDSPQIYHLVPDLLVGPCLESSSNYPISDESKRCTAVCCTTTAATIKGGSYGPLLPVDGPAVLSRAREDADMTSGGEEKEPKELTGEQRGHEKGQSIGGRAFGERFGFGYFKDTFDWFTGKGKKKTDKTDGGAGAGDGATPAAGDECHKLYLNHACMQRFVKNNHLRQIIPLPPEIDLNEWLASQIVPMYNHINLLYGTVTQFCTQATCPVMSAPNGMVYIWIDEKARKSKCSAPQYIDYVTASIEKLIKDDTVFPTKHGLSFPATFELTTRRVQRLLFHVLAHIYHAHFDAHVHLGTHVYLNGLFAHFVLFSQHFNLIESREFDVLRDLIDKLLADNDVIRESETATAATTLRPLEVSAGTLPPVSSPSDLVVVVTDQPRVAPVTTTASKPEQSKVICDTTASHPAAAGNVLTATRTASPMRLEPLRVREYLSGSAQKEGSVI
ncbi:putative MOB kinase activator-like 2 [Hypsibius exemplaris]|uniref:MOB kinase activator-like 2 n=1 Tax=Hypsibius exemplaris TaxID=2072580 RepID=A0A1W0WSE0_HYPEX|nr:putative MOB kinase activator-like 2 [Hypsibius exemplaris]